MTGYHWIIQVGRVSIPASCSEVQVCAQIRLLRALRGWVLKTSSNGEVSSNGDICSRAVILSVKKVFPYTKCCFHLFLLFLIQPREKQPRNLFQVTHSATPMGLFLWQVKCLKSHNRMWKSESCFWKGLEHIGGSPHLTWTCIGVEHRWISLSIFQAAGMWGSSLDHVWMNQFFCKCLFRTETCYLEHLLC